MTTVNTMRNATAGIIAVAVIAALAFHEKGDHPPRQVRLLASGQVEMCLSCHQEERLDPAHSTEILGCSSCHLGVPLAADKDEAHAGVVLNPGDLRVVARTCGVEGCHAQDAHRVENSLMATNRGIIATLLYYWGEAPDQYGDYSVKKLMDTGATSLALDYYRKLCATCHLWKRRRDLPGFFGEKGGGCTACHYQKAEGGKDAPEAVARSAGAGKDGGGGRPTENNKKPHPLITRKVPVENCVRCHNRSGRIGISYTGVYESDGAGAPFSQGRLSPNRLPGERFFQRLPPDIHYQKGMACIDCHTRDEIMGDGERHAHFEEQLEITCATCHTARTPGRTRKGKPLNNIRRGEGAAWVLVGKLDGREHPLRPPDPEACAAPGHERLSCQACHSTWVPQCYGCHVKRDMSETHLDKLTLKETAGWWEERRSYIRYEKPALGVWGERIMPVTPGCQDVVTLRDENDATETSFYSFTMAAIDPHTTQRRGRSCSACHASAKTLGLGEGTLWRQDGDWRFAPLSRGLHTSAGETPPLDAFVTIDGTQLQKGFRPDMRAFSRDELKKILDVGICLECHEENADIFRQP